MDVIPNKDRLSSTELPTGFSYPTSFDECLAGSSDSDLDPWGFHADIEESSDYGHELGIPVVKFAQAYFEDMIACFVVGTGPDPKVMVLNPWMEESDEADSGYVCKVLEEFPNFAAWLEWARNSDLVKTYAEVQADRERS